MGSRELWNKTVKSFNAMYETRRRFLLSGEDITPILAEALKMPHERTVALRLLIDMDESESRKHFSRLVILASVGHSDIHLCREALSRIDPKWREEQLPTYVLPLLENGGHEEYQRLAELLQLWDSPLCATLIRQALANDDPDIREVGEDFS